MNSPIEIQDAKDTILLNFVSQKIIGIIKLGDTNININNGSPKRVINLNEDSSGLNSKAEMIHENPNRKQKYKKPPNINNNEINR